MDDFLGTSIQYSEQQILKLEKEYAEQQEAVVRQIIDSGFLDSDWEDTTDNESVTSNESSSLLDENSAFVASLDLVDSNSNPSAPQSPLSSDASTSSLSSVSSPSVSVSPTASPSTSSRDLLVHYANELAMILASDANSAVDVRTLHDTELNIEVEIDEKQNNTSIIPVVLRRRTRRARENTSVEEEHRESGDNEDIIENNNIQQRCTFITSDLKLMILLILAAFIVPELLQNIDDINSNNDCDQQARQFRDFQRYCYKENGHLQQLFYGFKGDDYEVRECVCNNDNDNDQKTRQSFKRLFHMPAQQPSMFAFNLNFESESINNNNAMPSEMNQNQNNCENNNNKNNKIFRKLQFDPREFVISKHDLFVNHAIMFDKLAQMSQIGHIVIDIPKFSSMHIGKETLLDPVGAKFERKVMTWGSIVFSLFSAFLYTANTLSLPMPM